MLRMLRGVARACPLSSLHPSPNSVKWSLMQLNGVNTGRVRVGGAGHVHRRVDSHVLRHLAVEPEDLLTLYRPWRHKAQINFCPFLTKCTVWRISYPCGYILL